MNETLKDILEKKKLRAYAGNTIYQRGVAYYRQGRVWVVSANSYEAQCTVQGTHSYDVRLWISNGKLGSMCTCPYARKGWFCKHMVAAGLAVEQNLRTLSPSAWRHRLNQTLERSAPVRDSSIANPFWLFLSLQSGYHGKELVPYRLWVDRVPDGVLPPLDDLTAEAMKELVRHNQWILSHIKQLQKGAKMDSCVNCGPEEIAAVNLIREQDTSRYVTNYYHSYRTFPLASSLGLLARLDVPLFQEDGNNPMKKWLRV
ncbi:MAG: SWIM zinc finger family protein, partial [Chloroflexota bacterium]|nr:SWIM zinc finger family protein [Chloroflexota bacterium]